MGTGYRLYLPLTALVVLVVIAGCSGGYGPTLPSPDGGEGPGPAGQFCVNVVDGEGAPVDAFIHMNNAAVGEVPRVQTGPDGRICFSDLEVGQYGMTTAAAGLRTDHQIVEVVSEGGSVTVVLDEQAAGTPEGCPVVNFDTPQLNETAGTAVVSGAVSNTDGESAVILHNGQPTVIGIGTEGVFSQLFFLTPGVNTFQMMLGNQICTVIAPETPLQVTWTPPEGSDFVFRVTLTWNEGTSDPDLHTWSPNLAGHSSWHNKAITGGQLDVDDTEGFGPENFTATQIVPGRWRVAINSYDLDEATRYGVTVRVVTGGLASNSVSRVFGPHTFTTDNGEDYPVEAPNWWRPFDIVVTADGNVSVVGADNLVINNGAEVQGARTT